MAVSRKPVTFLPSIHQSGSRNLSFLPWMTELPVLMNPSNSRTALFVVVVTSFDIFITPLFWAPLGHHVAHIDGGEPQARNFLAFDPPVRVEELELLTLDDRASRVDAPVQLKDGLVRGCRNFV